MSSLLAQDGSGPAPDLTRPTLVIAVCAVIIIVTVLVQVVQARRRDEASGDGVVEDGR